MSRCSVYVSTVKIKAENELENMILFELSPTVAAELVLIFLDFFFILKYSQ